jgi:hypothetical protein
MAESTFYRSADRLTAEQVTTFGERLGLVLPGFRQAKPGARRSAWFEDLAALPELDKIPGFELGFTRIKGLLSLDVPPFPAFLDILARGKQPIGAQQCLAVSVGFEESASQQTEDAYDTISASVRKSRVLFDYVANGSRVMRDVEYAREFLQRVITTLDLPISMRTEGDHYFLAHTSGGQLNVSETRGIKGESPAQFRCEMQGVEPEDLVNRMKIFLERFATGKRFDSSWTAWPATNFIMKRLPEMADLYRAVREIGFPAQRYFLDASFFLDDFRGIDALRSLCGPGSIRTPLGGAELNAGNWLNFEIVTSADGHRIEIEARLPIEAAELADQLGMKLEQVS